MKTRDKHEDSNDESLFKQIVPPFICAGMGMVLAGLLLDRVQHWSVFVAHPELFTLVPALLGLKGNLEMTLASRLSTLANTGALGGDGGGWRKVAGANLALVQTQGIVVGMVAAAIPVAVSSLWSGNYTASKGAILVTSSVATASVASFLLGVIMIAVVAVSLRFGINPDNVATPLAASLGDLVTLALLVAFSSTLQTFSLPTTGASSNTFGLPSIVLSFFLALLPIAAWAASKDPQTKSILKDGWTPVLCAMAISSAGGKILENAIVVYPDMASYQPVINGVAGNLVSVHASRMSTQLHQGNKMVENGKSLNATTRRFLLALVIPGHLALHTMISILNGGDPSGSTNYFFLCIYLLSCQAQVWILLKMAEYLVDQLWSSGVDPDNAAIPYLTAAGDLLGGAFLVTTFYVAKS